MTRTMEACRQLSAGTIAGLIEVNDYETIDNWRTDFLAYVEMCESGGVPFERWQDAYFAYVEHLKRRATVTATE